MKRSDISDAEVVLAAIHRRRGEFITDALLRRFHECPEKVAMAAIERAEDSGYLDSGVSTRSGWVTDKGWALAAEAGDILHATWRQLR